MMIKLDMEELLIKTDNMLKIQIIWIFVTAFLSVLYYLTDDSHYRVIGVIYIIGFSIIANLVLLLLRFIYRKFINK